MKQNAVQNQLQTSGPGEARMNETRIGQNQSDD